MKLSGCLLVLLACSFGIPVGCKKDESEAVATRASGSEISEYQLRGLIKYIAPTGAEVEIHHEAMPEFVDRHGEKSGMMAMVMPFGLGEGLSLDGLAVGDKVEATLTVGWNRKPVLQITKIEKLPAATELEI